MCIQWGKAVTYVTIIQLKYFISLAESLSFSRVADEYNVAQTAVSYNIKALENELGIKLFNRTTKRTSLTDAGRVFYNKVKVAVDIVDLAYQEASADKLRRSFSIGCSKLISGLTFYSVANAFQSAHPDVDLVLSSDEPELGLFNLLDHGKIDLAVYISAPFLRPPDGSVTKEFHCSLPRKFIVSRQHPFAQHKEGVPVTRLGSERKISYGKLEEYQMMSPSAVETAFTILPPLIVRDFPSLLDMVGANLGVACLPMLDNLATESVCTVPCLETAPPEHLISIAATYMALNDSPFITPFITSVFQAISIYATQQTTI